MTIQFNADSSVGTNLPLIGDVFEDDGRSILIWRLLSDGTVEGIILDDDKIQRQHPEYPNVDAFYTAQLNMLRMAAFPSILRGHGTKFSGVRPA
jgi:hypothetical protein